MLRTLEAPAETEVRRETGSGDLKTDRFKMRDLFADERSSRTILDFLATTDVGEAGPERGVGVGELRARK